MITCRSCSSCADPRPTKGRTTFRLMRWYFSIRSSLSRARRCTLGMRPAPPIAAQTLAEAGGPAGPHKQGTPGHVRRDTEGGSQSRAAPPEAASGPSKSPPQTGNRLADHTSKPETPMGGEGGADHELTGRNKRVVLVRALTQRRHGKGLYTHPDTRTRTHSTHTDPRLFVTANKQARAAAGLSAQGARRGPGKDPCTLWHTKPLVPDQPCRSQGDLCVRKARRGAGRSTSTSGLDLSPVQHFSHTTSLRCIKNVFLLKCP